MRGRFRFCCFRSGEWPIFGSDICVGHIHIVLCQRQIRKYYVCVCESFHIIWWQRSPVIYTPHHSRIAYAPQELSINICIYIYPHPHLTPTTPDTQFKYVRFIRWPIAIEIAKIYLFVCLLIRQCSMRLMNNCILLHWRWLWRNATILCHAIWYADI